MRTLISTAVGRLGAAIAILVTLTTPATAQAINVSGNVHDGAGGPLLAGTVYHAVANLSVPAGTTLTVQAGAILKFNPGAQMVIHGTLAATGTAGARVIFTSIQDDSAGGDTNGNGPSTGNAADWSGLWFGPAADASALLYADVRFTGGGYTPGVTLSQADITLDHVIIRNGFATALDLGTDSVPAAVTQCSFIDNGGRAVDSAPLQAVPHFANNAASGNAGGNYLRVTVPSPAASLTIGPPSILNGALVLAGDCTLAPGVDLTLQAGVVIKWQVPGRLTVFGRLFTSGTPATPVVFTTFEDDDYGGDTNNNGPSAGGPAGWRSIWFEPSAGGSVLTHTMIRYPGGYYEPGITVNQANVTLDHVTIREGYVAALNLNHATSDLTVNHCSFLNNFGTAVVNVPIDAVPHFANNVASGNGGGNYLQVTTPSPTTNQAIGVPSVLNGALVFSGDCTIPAGVDLTLHPGVVIKWQGSGRMTVNGRLLTNGTAASPVVFTAFEDDDYGGDTNNNGPSSGGPGGWRSICFEPSAGGSVLTNTVLRYTGGYWEPGITVNQANVTLDHVTIRESYVAGLNLNHVTTNLTVSHCSFLDNYGTAVVNVPLDAVPHFLDNLASGNHAGNYLEITVPSPAASLTIGPESILNGVLVFNGPCTIPAGVDLTLLPGVVIKWLYPGRLTANGRLLARGTAANPVVLTAFSDDEYGGDTNNNGPSSGGPAMWMGVFVPVGSGASELENLIIRYTGNNWEPGLSCQSSAAVLRAVRVEHSYATGADLGSVAGGAQNLVVFRCGGVGVHLTGGSFGLLHATVAVNGGQGILATAAWTGQVFNTISWGNAAGNFSGFAAGQVFNSDGAGALAGTNGNIDVDPQFVDPAPTVGDLRLLGNSPGLNAGHYGTGVLVVKDFLENSRLLDHDLSGAMLPDMGAFERPAYWMQAVGQPRIGTPMAFTVTGPPGFSIYALGFLDGTVLLAPFGFLTLGDPATLLMVPVIFPVGATLPVDIPANPQLVGAIAGIQTLTVNPGGTAGNITNLYRATLRP